MASLLIVLGIVYFSATSFHRDASKYFIRLIREFIRDEINTFPQLIHHFILASFRHR